MGDNTLWVILIEKSGVESRRIAFANPPARDFLPLRHIAQQALRYDVAAVALIRPAANEHCTPCPAELKAVHVMRATLSPIGLALHDYILWHAERCESLRLAGRL
jgi:hypothetical protein